MTEQNTPELRFTEFKGEWRKSKLADVVNVYDGTHQTPRYTKEGIRFLSVENIRLLKSNKFISKEDFEKEFKIYPEYGDILMTRIGDIGTPKVVNLIEPLAYYVSLALLKPININSYFLESLILSPTVQNELWRKTLHIAFPKKINKNEIAKVMINYPKNEEQEKIGKLFSKLDYQIELEEEKLELLEQQKRGYIQKIFSQELKFKDERGNNHPSWKEMKLMEFLSVIDGDRGKNYPTKNDFMENGHTLFLSAANVTKQGFSLNQSQYITKEKSNSMGKGKLNINDVVLTTRGSIGNVFLYNEKITKKKPFVRINSGMLILRTEDYIKSFFITKYLASPLGKKQIDLLSFGSAQPQLTKKDIELYKMKLPVRQE